MGFSALTLAFPGKAQSLDLVAEGGKTVGWQAQRLKSLYGPSSAEAKSDDGKYTIWFYGEVGVLLNSQTQDVVGMHVPVDTAGESFRKALELALARNDAKQSAPTTNVPQQDPRPVEPRLRTWTDSTGKFRTDAVFLGLEGGKVRLKKKDGSVVIVPLDRLSKEDQEWVKQGELARKKAPSATHDPQRRYRRSGVPNQTRNITVKSIGSGRQEIKGGPVSVVDGKDIFEGPGTRDVHIEIDPAVGKTTYYGLTFTTPCVLDIRSDGTLLVDKEGIQALDEKQNVWESRKTTVDGKPAIAFFPYAKPEESDKPAQDKSEPQGAHKRGLAEVLNVLGVPTTSSPPFVAYNMEIDQLVKAVEETGEIRYRQIPIQYSKLVSVSDIYRKLGQPKRVSRGRLPGDLFASDGKEVAVFGDYLWYGRVGLGINNDKLLAIGYSPK